MPAVETLDPEQEGLALGDLIMSTVAFAQENAPRTQQAAARQLGMSDLGGCREFIRATIAGDRRASRDPLKWAAYIGTVIGDSIEALMAELGYVVQEEVTLEIDVHGAVVRIVGHTDLRGPNCIADFKTKDGLAEVRRDGPSEQNLIQLSGYMVARMQAGVIDENALGHLVYLDRSGSDDTPYVHTITMAEAQHWLNVARTRLGDVARALATGESQGYLRDEPESYCYAIGCDFYDACWEGYTKTDRITHPKEIETVAKFMQARDDENDAKERRRAYREQLSGVEGITPDGIVVKWTLKNNPGGVGDVLNVREPK